MSEEPTGKTVIRVLAEKAPLVVIGVVLVIICAIGKVPIGNQSIPVATPWRYILLVIGLALCTLGTVLLWRSPILKKSSLSVDPQPIVGRQGGAVLLDYGKLTNVDDLLDKVWYAISPRLPAGTYGVEWVLFDSESGHQYREIGTSWAKQSGRTRDERVLEEVGIKPGMKLQVVRPKDLPISRQAPASFVWPVTNDSSIDQVHDKLNRLDFKNLSDAELWKCLRGLFTRPMFYDVREEHSDTELFALCRTRLILERYVNDFTSDRSRERVRYLTTRIIKLYQALASLYGDHFAMGAEEYCNKKSFREAYIGSLPEGRVIDHAFAEEMKVTLKEINDTVAKIDMFNP